MAGRKDYEERKKNRIDGYLERSSRASAGSNSAYKGVSDILGRIPSGQPILVDHYSSSGHRRMLEKSDNLMWAAVKQSDTACYYEQRAEAAANNTAISSDDPEAIRKLEEKIECLQKEHENTLTKNKHYRKHGTMKGFDRMSEEEAEKMDTEIKSGQSSLFSQKNRTAEIRRLKKRVRQLKSLENSEPKTILFEGGKIVENEEENRTQISFDNIPNEEVRKALKGWGFRWSSYSKTWQRQRTPQATRYAIYIVGEHYTIE